jgi:anti-sigma B factor antagonist
MALNITEVPGLRGAGVTVLKLSGQVTLGRESQQLRQRIKSLLAEGKNQILVDLADVTHVDSAGLGTLVSSLTSVQGAGGRMKLANLTKKLQDVLSITKLVTVFEVFEDVDAGLASFV